MKLYDFNMLLSLRKGQTKVVIIKKNELFKVGAKLTVSMADEMIDDRVSEKYPFIWDATKKQHDIRHDKIDRFKTKVIDSMELKHK